jgi:hypothetical protein
MIIGLQGYAGSGKSTVAQYLVERHGFARRHIKHTLATMTEVLLDHALSDPERTWDYIDGDLKRTPIPELGNRSATEIQQFLGTEFGREFIHPDLWLDIWHRWAVAQPEHVVQESVRFANEAERCDVVWEIRREGYGAHNGHVSEGLPCAEPVILWNNGSVEDLYAQVDAVLKEMGA